MPDSMKFCNQCLAIKSLDCFYLKDKQSNRYSGKCKECELENQRLKTANKSQDAKDVRAEKRRNLYKNNIVYNSQRLTDGKTYYHKLRTEVIAKYGGKCACCGENIYEFLSIDHINGGGSKELSKEGLTKFLVKLRKSDLYAEYRVLCRNCNQSLGYYGYCPHNCVLLLAERTSSWWQKRYTKLRKLVVELYGSKCVCCSENHYEFLAIDHVYGNGAEERKVLTAERFLSKLLNIGQRCPDYRLLCHNCNSSFWYNGYCPHQK